MEINNIGKPQVIFDKLFENKTNVLIFIILVVIFTSLIIPKLGKKTLHFLNSDIIKFFIIGFIIYFATKNFSIALVTAIMLMVIIHSLKTVEIQDKLVKKINNTTQATSNTKVNLINKLLESNSVDHKQKIDMLKSLMQSHASDKQKYSSSLIMLDSAPDTVIADLYHGSNIQNKESKVNMTNRMLSCMPKHTIRVVKHLLKSDIDQETKDNIINKLLNSNIDQKTKDIILIKVQKASQ